MMHRYTLALIAATLLFAACRGPEPQPETQQPLPIVTLHGKSCFELTTRDTIPIIDDTYMDVENEFTINWPSLDSFPPATRRALILLAFADSTSPTLRQAGQRFLAQTWVDDDDWEILGRRPIDSVRHWPTNNATLEGNMTDFGTLLQFSVHSEYNVAYAAHGTYYTNNLLVDRSTGAVVSLADLMDTTHLGQLLLRALDEVPMNHDNGNTTECLFDEFKSCLPQPDGFTLDSTCSVITAYFNIYTVQPYACGMLFVDMPVSWLDAQAVLTPYGKKVFRLE